MRQSLMTRPRRVREKPTKWEANDFEVKRMCFLNTSLLCNIGNSSVTSRGHWETPFKFLSHSMTSLVTT